MGFKHETLIINKEAWMFLRNFDRTSHGYSPLSAERLDSFWDRMTFKNGGANPATHPITETEIRIDKDTFSIKWENVKHLLSVKNLQFRQDGFIQEGMYL